MRIGRWLSLGLCSVGLIVLPVWGADTGDIKSSGTIQLSKPTGTARTPDETMRLINQRLSQRKKGLKVIDKLVLLTDGDLDKLSLPSKILREYSIEQLKLEFSKLGILYLPALDAAGRQSLELSLRDQPAFAHGMVVLDLMYAVTPQKKNGVVAYALSLTVTDQDAVEEYMSSWDLPVVWRSDLVAVVTKDKFMGDVQKNISLLMQRAVTELGKK